jgi:rod shape-determining protein MreC
VWGRSKLIINLSVLLLVSFAIYNIRVPRLRGTDSFISYISYPVIFLNYKIVSWFNQSKKSLVGEFSHQKENHELQDLVANLQAANIALRAKSKYWYDTKEVINFAKRYKYKDKILAQVFFKYFKPQEHYFLLGKGEQDGVRRGMVAVYKNILLGRVLSVYPQYCRLVLLTDRSCKIAVYAKKTKAVGICRGLNDTEEIALNYVSHLQKLELGDQLISSGEGETFPRGFGVGRITKLENNGMYYKVNAELLLDIESIKYCYLIDANKS